MTTEGSAIFHLSFPVRSLDTALHFYRSCLGATVGRHHGEWADIILFGHQLTLHERPSQVLAREDRGVRHFGAILQWNHWESVRTRVLAFDAGLAQCIHHHAPGEPEEHVKLLVEDPDGNLIEIKAYRDIHSVIPELA
jgi:uncharacterized protein